MGNPSLLQGQGWGRSRAPQKQVCQPALRHCGRTPSPMLWVQAHVWGHGGILAGHQARILQNLLGIQGVRSCPLCGYPGEDGNIPSRRHGRQSQLCPAVASSESFGILGWFDSVPGSLADGTHSWQDMGAAGRAHPKSQGAYVCHSGGLARSTAPDRFKRCTGPHTQHK